MPIISTFFGIIIRMHFRDHEPGHFHAEHQGQRATFLFSGEPLAGSISSNTARRLIREWAQLHRAQLEANWAYIREGRLPERVEPLE